MAQQESSEKERFYRFFQQESAALEANIAKFEQLSPGGERIDGVEHCLAGIDRLQQATKDASSFIPAYDQRTYGEAINALREKLQNARSSGAPKVKFSFKTRKVPSVLSAPTEVKNGDVPSVHDKKETASSLPDNSAIAQPPASAYGSSSRTIINKRRTVVDMNKTTSTGLIIKDIKDTLILGGRVDGPIHITNMDHSILVVTCRQFRMHSSKNVQVYLHCSSRPIIEDCQGISFAPMPETYMREGSEGSVNQWDQVDDFKWLRSEPSPHWFVLPEKRRISERGWRDFASRPPPEDDEALEAMGLS